MLKNIELPGKDVRKLFKHAIFPGTDGTLTVVGAARPIQGGIPMCAEMVARYFARLQSGRIKLPKNMSEIAAEDKMFEDRELCLNPDVEHLIPSSMGYMDWFAGEVGCDPPSALRLLLTDPKLLINLHAGAFNSACYRLRGPGANYNDARKSLVDLDVKDLMMDGNQSGHLKGAINNMILALPLVPFQAKMSMRIKSLFGNKWTT